MPTAITVQLFINGAWTDTPGLEGSGWNFQSGPDVESGIRPGNFTYTINNDSLNFDPENVTGLYYGKFGLNTPARLAIGGFVVFTGECSAFKVWRTPDHVAGARQGVAGVDLVVEGLLRRIGRWDDLVVSPMRGQISSYASLLGYWPLEDPPGASQLQQAAPVGSPGRMAGTITLGGSDGAGGSAASVELGTGGVIRGEFAKSSASGYQLCWAFDLAAQPSSATYQPIMTWRDSRNRAWRITLNNANFGIDCTDSDGTVLLNTVTGYGTTSWTIYTRIRVKVTISASTVTVEPAWYQTDASTIVGFTVTFTATSTGQPTSWLAGGNTYTDGAGYGHLFAVTDTTLNLTGGYDAVQTFNGYLGETAGARVARLCSQFVLGLAVVGSTALSVPMGRQKPATLMVLLTQCVQSDAGMMYDDVSPMRLIFAMNNGLINRSIGMALALADLSLITRKNIDDVGVVNDVTLTNWDGTTATATLTTGAKSVLDPPVGVGRYKGGTELDISVSTTDRLIARTNWEMRRGTLDKARYPQITVDLLRYSAYATTVLTLRPGQWITVSGIGPDLVTLRIVSIERTGDAVTDKVTLNCVPNDMFVIGKYTDSSTSRYGSASTTVPGTLTAVANSVPISTVDAGDCWSTTSLPYDCEIIPAGGTRGERVTVTAMTAPAGTGPYTQTATVTRAVNGVALAFTAGARFNIWRIVRYGLG